MCDCIQSGAGFPSCHVVTGARAPTCTGAAYLDLALLSAIVLSHPLSLMLGQETSTWAR